METNMAISMFEASVPSLKHILGSLAAILRKAADHAGSRKIDQSVFISARLFPDMLPLIKQVQIATDMSKLCAARLAGIDIPKFEDNETTFDDLQARIAKTIAFLDGIKVSQINGSEEREIVLQLHETKLEFKGKDFLLSWVLPNVYFHVTTAYAILRHNGVEIGKKDYLGG